MAFVFKITHLYPKEMSIYGDIGNILAMQYRLKKYGVEFDYQVVNVGDELPEQTDFYFIGGGQDKEQINIFKDLQAKKDKLIKDIENGDCLLSICGGYQLLGKEFLTGTGENIPGIGLFEVTTKAPGAEVKQRCTGNLIIESNIAELQNVKLVGFENHSGQTFFTSNKNCYPLGKVLYGFGNNSSEKLEGCIYKNAIGTYLHGSCLPKNPELADFFIFRSLQKRYEQGWLKKEEYQAIKKIKIDDTISQKAKQNLVDRFVEQK